ncbi:MAG: glycine zipper 2TM domain-containing protein [Pseudomonadota bacterium]
MKTQAITALLCITAAGAQAQEVGQVISRTAVYQQVAVPRQTCTTSQPTAEAQPSGGGAILGALTGGVIGSQFGGRDSKGLTAMVGVIGGAMLGSQIESQGTQTPPQTTCTTQTVYENRLTGYNVVYEYAGKQYNVQLPQDPGPTIPLQVTPLAAPRSEAPANTVMTTSAPPVTVVNESRVVYVPAPVYRSYPPVYTHIDLGWGWNGGHRHGHWR